MVTLFVGKENAGASGLRNADEPVQAEPCEVRKALPASWFETMRRITVEASILAIFAVLVLRGIDIAMHG